MITKPPITSGARKKSKVFAAAIVLVIAAVFAWVVFIWSIPSRAITEADHGFKRAKQNIEPEIIRSWALRLIEINTNGYRIINQAEIPVDILKLYSSPPHAFMSGSNVYLIWGGGFFHWRLSIGATNNLKPFNSGNPQCPYNFEWKPGIYYTREANRDLR